MQSVYLGLWNIAYGTMVIRSHLGMIVLGQLSSTSGLSTYLGADTSVRFWNTWACPNSCYWISSGNCTCNPAMKTMFRPELLFIPSRIFHNFKVMKWTTIIVPKLHSGLRLGGYLRVRMCNSISDADQYFSLRRDSSRSAVEHLLR